MIFARNDPSKIRRNASKIFDHWDALIAEDRTVEAEKIRKKVLWPLVRAGLASEASDYPGIYVCLDNSISGWSGVNYIGITTTTLRNRWDHYARDDSCWDEKLVASPDGIETIGRARLRPVMSRTAEETFLGYLKKHKKTAIRMKGCSLFVAGFELREFDLIHFTEAALIAVAWSNGAPLQNRKLDNLPQVENRSRVLSICRQIFDGWRDCGLNSSVYSAAISAVERAGG